jgi:anthranilate phosphoribosyltransferase
MNAAAALVIAGMAKSWTEGAQLAASLLDQGHALNKLKELQRKA